MEIIENTPLKIVLRVAANESLINAVRRSINEIPILAIDEVEIFKNDSALYDEFLAHRIGLVPLKTESGMNEKTEIELKLSKTGPGMVLAGDFSGKAEIVYPSTPLTLLEKEQEVEIVATARLGMGVQHEKYTPGLCHYRHLVIVNSKNPQVIKLAENSRGVIRAEKQKEGWLCDLNEAQIEEICALLSESVKPAEELIGFIESFGHLPAKDILVKAIKALSENLETFEKMIK